MNFLNLVPLQILASGEPVIFWFGPQGMPLWILGPTALAFLIYYFGRRFNLPVLKYLAIVPLAIGVLIGAKASLDLNDPIYQSMYDINGKRSFMSIATLVVPILAAGAMLFLDFRNKQTAASRL